MSVWDWVVSVLAVIGAATVIGLGAFGVAWLVLVFRGDD